jgi:hypothetical protein
MSITSLLAHDQESECDEDVDEVSLVGAKDWRSVTDFEDPLTSEHHNLILIVVGGFDRVLQ